MIEFILHNVFNDDSLDFLQAIGLFVSGNFRKFPEYFDRIDFGQPSGPRSGFKDKSLIFISKIRNARYDHYDEMIFEKTAVDDARKLAYSRSMTGIRNNNSVFDVLLGKGT